MLASCRWRLRCRGSGLGQSPDVNAGRRGREPLVLWSFGKLELEPRTVRCQAGGMPPETRAMIAATAHAFVIGKKVTGLYDHSAGRHLRIAAESRKPYLQGYDGDRDARFGGTLPELRDAGSGAQVHMIVRGSTVTGYDKSSSGHFTAEVTERLVQLYDHVDGVWFVYDVQSA